MVGYDLFWIGGKDSNFVGVIRMFFSLVFGSGFISWIGGWTGDLCDFSFRLFILVGDLNFSVDTF